MGSGLGLATYSPADWSGACKMVSARAGSVGIWASAQCHSPPSARRNGPQLLHDATRPPASQGRRGQWSEAVEGWGRGAPGLSLKMEMMQLWAVK